ncbi:MAG: dihydropteroate synthase [Proteobacteria bacterium]|nr:dihydropteroate synthase [Pseudomonadota bacterium]
MTPAPVLFAKSKTLPLIMGVLNVTPDSFSDGGKYLSQDSAIEHGIRLMDEGCDILDIGGESTRFIYGVSQAVPISIEEEQKRALPVLTALSEEAKRRGVRLSIDTYHPETMRAALKAGADIINDVTALTHDPENLKIAKEAKVPVILMHMQAKTEYAEVAQDVFNYLKARIDACVAAGVPKEWLVIDPGIGFGKTPKQSAELLGKCALFHQLGVPVMIGASRKSFIGALAGAAQPDNRLPGSIAAALYAAQQGVQILRVHDVKETRQALKLWQALQSKTA